jgi:hypothetical protein
LLEHEPQEAMTAGDRDPRQSSPAMIRLTVLLVAAAGAYCAWQAGIGLWTGAMPLPSRGSASAASWESQPGWYLAALVFYALVVAAALWAVVRYAGNGDGRKRRANGAARED